MSSVVRVRPDLSFEVIDREKEMVRLGAGSLDGRPLTETAITAALRTVSRFKRLAEAHEVDDIVAAATTEVTLGNAADVHLARSFKLGVIRLTERFVKSDPLTGADERRLVGHITALVELELWGAGRQIKPFEKVLGRRVTIEAETAVPRAASTLPRPLPAPP